MFYFNFSYSTDRSKKITCFKIGIFSWDRQALTVELFWETVPITERLEVKHLSNRSLAACRQTLYTCTYFCSLHALRLMSSVISRNEFYNKSNKKIQFLEPSSIDVKVIEGNVSSIYVSYLFIRLKIFRSWFIKNIAIVRKIRIKLML